LRAIAYQSLPSHQKLIPKPRFYMGIARAKEFKFRDLATLFISLALGTAHRWWLRHAERHYLICADVELARAREAMQNVAYYQRRAAMARSARQ
jgi:hypothetical protein